jgi:N-acyl amino acid synthase FeeM
LRQPEGDDYRPDVLILVAERKIDRQILGSMRLQPNFDAPLRIEGEVKLPEKFEGRRLIEAMRLGVENGTSGRMVMVALVKAAFEICHACAFDFALVAGRRSVAAIYRSMLFDDVLEGRTIPLSYADNVQHSVLSMPIADADRRWRESNHALYDFMARTEHRDIQIDYDRVFAVMRRD